MTELEKFKRRMIRIVERLHLKEKKPEDELWEDLKKETKCDCKWLWERMRTLTLKRLKRLIIADDRHDCITSIARMSLTDWLLYDLILVHEKIDVIGAEMMGEKKVEPRPLFELFSLVQRFELEGLTGERLAAAWTAATFTYNSTGRQCSPMLLQRRWYQMKEATRNRFYKFWFTYRGNLKLLQVALNDTPTRLQMAIAKRFPHIVTKTFLSWEDMIEKKMVILPDEFQVEMKKQIQPLPKPNENDPDLVLMEPEIETIDLRVDSDSDNELKEQVECEKNTKISDMETASALAGIGATPKLEPEEISEDDDFGDIEALENIEIPMETTPTQIDDSPNLSASNEQVTGSAESERIQDNEPEPSKSCEQMNESAEPEIILNDHVSPQAIQQSGTDEDIAAIDESMDETIQEPVIIPQITNVFGNVHIGVEALAKLSTILDNKIAEPVSLDVHLESEASPQAISTSQTSTYSCNDDDEELEEDIIKTEIIDESYMQPEFDRNMDSRQVLYPNITTKVIDEPFKCDETVNEKPANLEVEEVTADLTFDDEGIEFEDDGIVVDNDEHSVEPTSSQNYTSTSIKTELRSESEEDEKGDEEMAKFDLKLLMDPVVYTIRIEEMSVFKNITLFNARCKEVIDRILSESKPVNKININDITKEKLQPPCDAEEDDHKIDDDLFDKKNITHVQVEKCLSVCDDEGDNSKIGDDLFDNNSNDSDLEYIPENKKVKLTSNLLQKPRNRNYNPITLCKNPDFNTRLKRLTVGFLSSTRNRRLLKTCKPLTIDVSKSFESKIIDNTLYLKSCPNYDHMNEVNMTDDKFNEIQRTISVIPSAMPAQSLIDIMKTNMEELMNKQSQPVHVIHKPLEDNSILYERNKVINLPHIDNVRRINQKLLVAEVSPIQVNPAEVCVPPVQIVPRENVGNDDILKDHPNNIHSEVLENGRKETDISSGKVICSGKVIRGTNREFITHDLDAVASTSTIFGNFGKRSSLERMFDKYKLHAGQHQVNRKRANPLNWTFGNSKNIPKQTLQNYAEEYLITIDTLNKMLNLMDESRDNPVKSMLLQEKAKKISKSKVVMKRQLELQAKLSEYEQRMKGDIIRPPGTDILTMLPPPTPKQKRVRGKRDSKAMKSNDKSTGSCETKRKDTMEPDESMKKACESIESVVEQTRELIENKEKSSLNTETAIKTVDASTSTSDANTKENTSDTIEIDNTCIEIDDDTPLEVDDTPINVENFESSVPQTTMKVQNNAPNVVEESSTSLSVADPVPSNSISVDDVRPVQGTHTIDNNIIEIDDSSMDVSASKVQNLLPPNNDTITDDNPEKTNKVIPASIVIRRGRGRPCKNTFFKIDVSVSEHNLNPTNNSAVTVDNPEETNDAIPALTAIRRGRGRPPKIITRITSAPENKFSSQRSVTASSSRDDKYQSIPCVKEPDANQEKVLYLSSKHLSKQPNNQPIFLGKNKILLTDIPLPNIRQNKTNANGIVLSQYFDQSVISLPKGVDLVLLPNGDLSCTIAPETHLDYEQLALIPTILSSLRQQMSSGTIPGLIPLETPNPSVPDAPLAQIDEVVNISDDENYPEKSANEGSTGDIISNQNVITSPDNVTQPSLSDKSVVQTNEPYSTCPTESESENAVILDSLETVKRNSEGPNNETEKNDNKHTISSTSEQNINTVPEMTEKDSVNFNRDIEKNIEVENETVNPIMNDENTEKTQESDSATAAKKTILSDLMEMSGIFEEDILPSSETAGNTQDVPIQSTAVSPTLVVGGNLKTSEPKVNTPSLVVDAGQIAFGNTVVNLPELNPITSFAELKYAFEKSGNFFKLDLTTRVLAPINVCIKKNEKGNNTDRAIQPKILTVDLTDENDETIMIANKPGILTRQSEAFAIQDKSAKCRMQKPVNIKPLKLIKVIRPNILRGNKKLYRNNDSPLVSILKRHKQEKSKRKNSEPTPFVIGDSDDSSDDEPLAKKVQRKNGSTEVSASKRVDAAEPISEDVPAGNDRLENPEECLPNDRIEQTEESSGNDRLEQAEECLPIECLEQAEKCLPNERLEQAEECLPNERLEEAEECLPNERLEEAEECLRNERLEEAEECLLDNNVDQEGDISDANDLTMLESGVPTELSFISDDENNSSDEDLCILGV